MQQAEELVHIMRSVVAEHSSPVFPECLPVVSPRVVADVKLELIDFSEDSRFHQAADCHRVGVQAARLEDHKLPSLLPCRFIHLTCLLKTHRHGFVAENMTAVFQGFDCVLRMVDCRGSHNDKVRRLMCQQFFEGGIAGGDMKFRTSVSASVTDRVNDRGDLKFFRMSEQCGEMVAPCDPSESDYGCLQYVLCHFY